MMEEEALPGSRSQYREKKVFFFNTLGKGRGLLHKSERDRGVKIKTST